MSLLFASLFSCKEGDSYNISQVTTFATFEYEPQVVVEVGGSFTPNVVAKEGETTINSTYTGSVDVNTVGVYEIVYSATNTEGYDGTATQTVIVYDPTLTGTDMSGTIYQSNNAARTGTVSLVTGTTNVYYATDVAFGGVFPMYFQMIGDVLEVIPQQFALGVTSVTASYDAVGRKISLTVFPQEFSYIMVYN